MNNKPLKFRAPEAGIAEANPSMSQGAGQATAAQGPPTIEITTPKEAMAGDGSGGASKAREKSDPAPEDGSPAKANVDDQAASSGDAAQGELTEDPANEARRNARRLKRQCERLLLLDPEKLSMPEWPADSELAKARRRRDMWLAFGCIGAMVFLGGFAGLVPAWVAGAGMGLCLAIVAVKLTGLDRLASGKSTHSELVSIRRRLLRKARDHVAFLESDTALAWHCSQMAPYNSALRSGRFDTLAQLSMQKRLIGNLRQRKHFRLYLIFMLEAEKAYRMLDIDAAAEDDVPESAFWPDGHEEAHEEASRAGYAAHTDHEEAPASGNGSIPEQPDLDKEAPQT